MKLPKAWKSNSGDKPGKPWPRPAPGHKAASRDEPPEARHPTRENLGKLLRRYGVDLPAPALEKLWRYHQLLRAHNHDLDLTRLIGFDTIAQRHYADCLILHSLLGGRWPSPLVDVGSGAGFPGLMIKLASPGTELILAEPRPRRVEFLELCIRELGLEGIRVFPHKVTSRSFTGPCAGAISRAFETVAKTLPRLGGAIGPGGRVIFMKGPGLPEEMRDLDLGPYKIIRDQAYTIPNTTLRRVLLVLERTA